MSYNVTFYTFSKRDNSTKLPTGLISVGMTCDLMDSSGILAPTLIINHTDPTAFNYCYITEFHRYYFINNWRYSLGFWTCEMQVDVLASWKAQIIQQELYVLRSASNFNGRIADTTYPLIAQKTFASGGLVEGAFNPFSASYQSGYFVVGIINTDSGAIGAVSYYVFTPAQFKTLVDKLMGDVSFYNVSDISDDLTKILANPFQYISSCLWFPFQPPTGASITSLPIGWWTFNISCSRLSGYSQWSATGPTLSIPKHPDALTRGYYLLAEPYTEYYLWFPPWGNFSIPADKVIDSDYLTFSSRVDCITGMGELRVYPYNSNVALSVIKSQIGVPIELAQLAPQLTNIPEQVVSTAQNLPAFEESSIKNIGVHIKEAASAIENFFNTEVGSTVSTIAGNIGTMILSKYCPSQSVGSTGSIMEGYVDPLLYAYFSYQTDMDSAEKGRPLCQKVRLSTLTGFVLCGEADINIACTKTELEAIKLYLTSGLFIE